MRLLKVTIYYVTHEYTCDITYAYQIVSIVCNTSYSCRKVYIQYNNVRGDVTIYCDSV